MFWKVVRFYGMTDAQVLAMPIDRFWSAVKMIGRIDAEFRLADLRVANAAVSAEGSEKLQDDLKGAVGTTLVLEQGADPDAFDKLKQLL